MTGLKKIHFKQAKLKEINDEIPNPERGWYQIHTFVLGDEFTMKDREYTLNKTDTIAFVLIDISAYKNKPIDEAGIKKLYMIFDFFRDYRLDMIVRVVYDTVGRCMENEPSNEEQIMEHISQIAPVLKEYAGEIFVYQGLLIGNWGEMHSSKFLSPGRLRRLAAVVMEKISDTAFLAVRRPAYVRILFPEGEDIRQRKVGIFDDAILASVTHMGTFGDMPSTNIRREMSWQPSEELQYVAQLCDKVPYGGEALWEDEPDELMTVRHSLEETVRYFKTLHLSYLNRIHDVNFIENLKTFTWEGKGVFKGMNGYDYVGRHLGYRFVIRKVKCKRLETDKSLLRWDVTIENVGFSRAFFDTVITVNGKDAFGNGYVEDISDWVKLSDIGSSESRSFVFMTLPMWGPVYIKVIKKATRQSLYFANERDDNAAIESAVLLGTIR